MSKKRVKRERPLEISIYLKSNNKADVVFRKNRVLYRMAITGAGRFVAHLNHYFENLRADLLMEMQDNRMCKWVLEIGLLPDEQAALNVWKMAALEYKPCFKWTGAQEDLGRAFRY